MSIRLNLPTCASFPAFANNITSNIASNYRQAIIAPQIVDDISLKQVQPGDFVYSVHLNKLTHLIINQAQQFFGFGNPLMHNATHVGVVTEVANDRFKASEIPGYGLPLSENEYLLKDLYKDEEFLFTKGLSKTHELDAPYVAQTGKLWAEKAGTENQYNVVGVTQLPFKNSRFSLEDKKAIINDLLDSRFLKRNPHTIQSGQLLTKKFFCSEYSLQMQQVAHLDRELGQLDQGLIQKISALDLDNPLDRNQAIQLMLQHVDDTGIWKKLEQNPLYTLSAEKSTPSTLATLAMKTSDVIRIRNPEAQERYGNDIVPEKDLVPYLEYATTRIAKKAMDGEPINAQEKEVGKLLSTLEGQCDYSKESLECFWDKCLKSDQIAPCIESCLKDTLSWKEKLYVYVFSREINRAADYLIRQPKFVNFLESPTKENFDKIDISSISFTKSAFIEKAFPENTGNWLSKMENHYIKRALDKIDQKSLIKYIPLALSYSPPSETLKAFLKDANIDVVSLAIKIKDLYTLASQGYEAYADNSKLPSFVWTSLNRLGFIKTSNSALSILVDKTAQQTSYSKETLNCIVDKFNELGIKSSNVEDCLKSTLTAQESLQVLATSKTINQGVENLLKNEAFLEFIRKGVCKDQLTELYKSNTKNEVLLDLFFPTNTNDMMTNGFNYASKSYLSSSLKKGVVPFILKDVLLALGYDSPSAHIQQFLEQEHLTKEDLVVKLTTLFIKPSA